MGLLLTILDNQKWLSILDNQSPILKCGTVGMMLCLTILDNQKWLSKLDNQFPSPKSVVVPCRDGIVINHLDNQKWVSILDNQIWFIGMTKVIHHFG